VLVILVAPDGDVQNRVIFTARDHQQAELIEATNYLNAHYAGLTIEEVRGRLKTRNRRAAHRDRHAHAGGCAGWHRGAGREHRQGGRGRANETCSRCRISATT
jgi:transcriptional regulator of heat shock response